MQHVQVVDTGNNWLRKGKWSVDFARGNGTKRIHFSWITDVIPPLHEDFPCPKCVRCDGSPDHTHETSPRHWKAASQQTRVPLAAVGNSRRSVNENCDPADSAPAAAAVGILSREDVCAECAKLLTVPSAIPGSRDVFVDFWELLTKVSRTRSTVRPMASAGLFVSQRTGSHSEEFHVPLMNCFVRKWFCVLHGPKPPLNRHNWLSFGKFQETERFLIPWPRHVSSRLLPSGETCKYATAPITQTNLHRFSTYWYAPSCCVCLRCCAAEFGSSGGTESLLRMASC